MSLIIGTCIPVSLKQFQFKCLLRNPSFLTFERGVSYCFGGFGKFTQKVSDGTLLEKYQERLEIHFSQVYHVQLDILSGYFLVSGETSTYQKDFKNCRNMKRMYLLQKQVLYSIHHEPDASFAQPMFLLLSGKLSFPHFAPFKRKCSVSESPLRRVTTHSTVAKLYK